MKRIFLGMLISVLFSMVTNAQIGYQVSLLNSATGEPRANETVNANIVITDAQDKTVYSTTQSATTNDFGVLSFVVGNANTFKDVAIGRRLPLYISVTVGGSLIGKSQILSVPVAEIANTLKSDFTLEEMCSALSYYTEESSELQYPTDFGPIFDGYIYKTYKMTVNVNGTWTYVKTETRASIMNGERKTSDISSGEFEIEGNTIYFYDHTSGGMFQQRRYHNSKFY